MAESWDELPEPGSRRRLTMDPPGLFPFVLSRLLDHELTRLGSRVRAIEPNYGLALELGVTLRGAPLPQVFFMAQRIFGRTSERYDDFKGSFYFPLLLSATRDGLPLRYVVLLEDRKGAIEMVFLRYHDDPVEPWPHGYLSPVDHELSRADIDRLSKTVIHFLCDRGRALIKEAPSFYRVVRAVHLVYGCQRGEPFVREIDDEDEYDRLVAAIAEDLDELEQQREREEIEALFDDISRGEIRHR